MLDPAEFLDEWHEGAVESGNPSTGPDGLAQPELVNDPESPPAMFQVFDVVSLANGATETCRADSRPSYWLVALDATASSGVSIYQGSGAGGLAVKLGPSGRCRIPAQSTENALTLLGTGSGAANVTVIACRGLHAELVREG